MEVRLTRLAGIVALILEMSLLAVATTGNFSHQVGYQHVAENLNPTRTSSSAS
jgi:hypothetical protein